MPFNLSLLPEPQALKTTGSRLRLPKSLRVFIDPAAGAGAFQAALTLSGALRSSGIDASIDHRGGRSPRTGDMLLMLQSRGAREDYRLSIGARNVLVTGHGEPGLFYGIQTLTQIVRAQGANLPGLVLRDAPAFAHRGFYLDVTRGKVPSLATLKRLADRLSALKINQLQLYVEHTFAFRFDPDIGDGTSPLTPEDILELDAYCRARHIELVPSLACFGHMGRILSLPAYRRLAEVEWPAPSWSASSWPQRLRGATLNPRLKGSKQLIESMLDDYLPLFSSEHFNACCDETYDLGRGANAGAGIQRLYADHIRFLRKAAHARGKRLMFWGDVMLQHPEAIARLPSDCVALDWGYSRLTPFDKVGLFTRGGLEAYVCPSTRGYRVVFNQVEEARANIAGYARAGRRHGARGMLTTDWGDMGHFNMLACSLHGMALGAAMAWNPASDEGERFDRAFDLQVFGDTLGVVSRLYRRLGASTAASWPFFLAPLAPATADLAAEPQARYAFDEAIVSFAELSVLRPAAMVESHDIEELSLAALALAINARKIRLAHTLRRHGRIAGPAALSALRAYADQLDAFTSRYVACWLAANRTSEVREIRSALRGLARRARALARNAGHMA